MKKFSIRTITYRKRVTRRVKPRAPDDKKVSRHLVIGLNWLSPHIFQLLLAEQTRLYARK